MRELNALVLENVRIAENIYSLTFATEEPVPVRCGQFAMLGVNGFPLRRPIAICKAEGNRVTVCYQIKGAGTRTLAETYKPREHISVLLPLGNGFEVGAGQKRVAVVGGGVGIFPLVSVIRAYCAEKEIYAYMGFRDRAAICMESELGRAKKLVISTDDGSLGRRGTSVQAFMDEIDKIAPDVVLSCGPVPMLRALKSALSGRGIPAYASLEERMGCGIGACLVCVCDKNDGTHARVCKDGPVFDLSKIVL